MQCYACCRLWDSDRMIIEETGRLIVPEFEMRIEEGNFILPFCQMKFTNASEIGKEILTFNIFLITEYIYRVCIFVVQNFQEKDTKIIVEISIKNANVNKIENT